MMNFNDYDTFVFDFDGTLLNSEPYHKLAHSMVLTYILNRDIKLTDDEFSKYLGKSDNEIFEMYKIDFNVDFDKDKMINKKVEIAKKLLSSENVKVFDYFYDLMQEKGNKKFYIVSNQHENILFSILKKKNVISCFDDVFCLSKMKVKKKDFYNDISKYLPCSNKVIVFEDDVNVLKFLENIGFTVVAVKSDINCDKISNNFKNIIDCS